MTWEVRVRKLLTSIVPFQESNGDLFIANLKVREKDKIKNGKTRIQPLEKVFCRIGMKARINSVRHKMKGSLI
jgi:hypothetical protein